NYDEDAGTGEQKEYPATQETLDAFGITASLNSFKAGNITKPMSIPGTYQKVKPHHQGLKEFLASPVRGTADGFDIIFFIFMLGGTIGVINYVGAFAAGIGALAKTCRGREQIILIVITALIAFMGSIEGFCEETIALYPVLVPVFLAAGYDAITAVGAIYMGSTIGCMFSTINPFSVGIASYAAGITMNAGLGFRAVGLVIGCAITVLYLMRYARKIRKNPELSLVADQRELVERKFATVDLSNIPEFTTRKKICLLIFIITFGVMIWGIMVPGWWFEELSELFLISGVVIGIVGGIGEKNLVREFVNGAADLVGVALILGVARAVTILLDNGNISGTILESMSSAVSGMPPAVFIVLLMLVYVVLGFFINSSSGLAVLSIPIMAPLADVVGIPRELIVSAYLYGLGIITFITPTGIIMPSLEVVETTYDRWLKLALPLVGILTVFGAIMLVL
ncbi:MAG: YfcC family protein, partial [Bacillota bacterium]|nr:YfcC family protein [Bacillota bacterium]